MNFLKSAGIKFREVFITGKTIVDYGYIHQHRKGTGHYVSVRILLCERNKKKQIVIHTKEKVMIGGQSMYSFVPIEKASELMRIFYEINEYESNPNQAMDLTTTAAR
jgi:hypothetical protein